MSTIRLVDREEIMSQHDTTPPPYATLSHVWGEEQIFTLTTKNMSDLQHAIGLKTLPQCFQDAVNITRGLGIRYLWIDSLWWVMPLAETDRSS